MSNTYYKIQYLHSTEEIWLDYQSLPTLEEAQRVAGVIFPDFEGTSRILRITEEVFDGTSFL